jgi:diguanylate cyclase (GGDEF)-like protein/PAS domain S-box-containing protein
MAGLRAVQAALDRREAMLARIIDKLPAVIGYWDTDLVCHYANAAHKRRFGRDPAALVVGLTAREIMGEKLFATRGPMLRRALGGETVRHDHGLTAADGSVLWNEATMMPDRDGADGPVRGVLVLSFDVTERKRLETALAEAHDRARDVNAILARLLELTGSVIGDAFFERTVQAMSELLQAELVFVARIDPGPPGRGTVLAAWCEGQRRSPWEYDVPDGPGDRPCSGQDVDTACVARRGGGAVMVRNGVGERFAAADGRHYEACLVVPVTNAKGVKIAELTAAFLKPLDSEGRENLMFETARFFAARVETELERLSLEAARAAAAAALHDEKERLRVTLHAIGDGVIVTDPRQRVTMMNAAAETLTGRRMPDTIGADIDAVMPLFGSDGGARLPLPLRAALADRSGVAPTVDAVLLRQDGSELAVDTLAAPIFGQRGELIGSVTVLHDMTESRALLNRVRELAHYDTLTGLPNRALFRERLTRALALAVRSGRKCGLMFLDMDRFKHVNDTLGHAVGDLLLREVAERLRRSARETDTVARLGGDEFVIILNGMDGAADAAAAAHRILETVSQIDRIAGHDIDVSFSIGIATFPDDAQDADDLLMRADAAMYQAKDQGRNVSVFFDAEVDRATQRRHQIRLKLSRALQLRQFVLHYQPRVELATGRTVGAEALIRWHLESGEAVSPGDFIPIAEDDGQIVPISHWVIDEACRQMRVWRDAGLPAIPVSVNISMKCLREPEFVALLRRILHFHELAAHLLELEITETAAMTESGRSLATLADIRKLGIRVAIDDFGTGFSSLARLQRLPVDAIKIDQGFVADIAEDEDDAALVQAIVAMAATLRKHVVAEGVETQAQRLLLLSFGCQEAQGFLFSRPLDPARFAELMAAQLAATRL